MIAYIPHEKNVISSQTHDQFDQPVKMKRLHQLYEKALQDFRQTQNDTSLNKIELCLGNKTKIVDLKIPLMFIIGDIQGGYAICGRHINYGITAHRISRMCDAGPKQYKKPKVGMCKRLIMQDVMDLAIKNDSDALENLFQAPH